MVAAGGGVLEMGRRSIGAAGGGALDVGRLSATGGGTLDELRAAGGSERGRTTAKPGTSWARIWSSQARAADTSTGSGVTSWVGLGFSSGGSTSVDAKRNGPPAGGSLGGRLTISPCSGTGSDLTIGSVLPKPLFAAGGAGPAPGGDDEIGRCGIGTIGGALAVLGSCGRGTMGTAGPS